jgi:hypothetical protein
VASITGAKNLITTGFVAISYPPQNNADIAQHITDLRSQRDKSQELRVYIPSYSRSHTLAGTGSF